MIELKETSKPVTYEWYCKICGKHITSLYRNQLINNVLTHARKKHGFNDTEIKELEGEVLERIKETETGRAKGSG